MRGFAFDGEDACIAFAREHLTTAPTYHCILSLMFALCMPSDEVIYKSDMQGGEIHAARTAQNQMQPAVILSVNTIILPILEGLKGRIRELMFNFKAARMYEDWLPANSHGGMCKNLKDGMQRAFEGIKGAIQMTLGSPLAKTVMMELHGKFLMHFNAVFITKVSSFYLDILGKKGGTPPFSAAVVASCWAFITELLRVMIKEIHRICMHAESLEFIQDDPAQVNGLCLYATMEKLRVLREFAFHEYRQHPKFHHFVVMHLFDTALPHLVFEAQSDGMGRNMLRFTHFETTLTNHGTSIDRLKTALGTVWQSLGLPVPATRNHKQGAGKGILVTKRRRSSNDRGMFLRGEASRWL
jgi:hypothetical protein